jgi:hypothetical protein
MTKTSRESGPDLRVADFGVLFMCAEYTERYVYCGTAQDIRGGPTHESSHQL